MHNSNISVYDLPSFVQAQHSDTTGEPSNSQAILEEIAGSDMTDYFPPPLSLPCEGLVTDNTPQLTSNFTSVSSMLNHASEANAQSSQSKLSDENWYTDTFLPKIKQFRKVALVRDTKMLRTEAEDTNDQSKSSLFLAASYVLTNAANRF